LPLLNGLGIELLGSQRTITQRGHRVGFDWREPGRVPNRYGVPKTRPRPSPIEVEAHGAVRQRKELGDVPEQPVNARRYQSMIGLRQCERGEGIVTGKQFVTSVSRQGDGRLASGKSAEQVRRKDGRIAQRLVKRAEDAGEQLASGLKVEPICR